jgi:uncharacterized BrkB/YihY/UPF0761 family membrane protein
MRFKYVLTLLVLAVALWLGYNFVVGFIQGFKEGWHRQLSYKRRKVWRLWKREYFDRNL